MRILGVLCLLLPHRARGRPWARGSTHVLFASIRGKLPQAMKLVSGTALKHPANPLLVQDRPWEPRCDNGYPNVLQGTGKARNRWHLWYGCMTSGIGFDTGQGTNRTPALLYAHSPDGIRWTKPSLGVYDLSRGAEAAVAPALAAWGTRNNIVASDSDGVGLFPDMTGVLHAFGKGCFGPGGVEGCVEGVARSDDGIAWRHAENVSFPPPQRYNCHQNAFWSTATKAYMFTTRLQGSDEVRSVGLGLSREWPPQSSAPIYRIWNGTRERQYYSQITFPWHDVLLGLLMIYAPGSTRQAVRCRLAWARDPRRWELVGDEDFIPLGRAGAFDDHIIFAANRPATAAGAERIYYMGGNGPHSGRRNSSLGLAVLRKDGYVAVEGSGTVRTTPLFCTGKRLLVTADVLPGGPGSVRLGVVGSAMLDARLASPVEGNVTNHRVAFTTGRTLAEHVGELLELEVIMDRARVYTVAFSP